MDPLEPLLRRIPGWADRPVEITPAIPVLASPSWRGVDGAPLIARDTETGARLFIKRLHPDTAFYITPEHAFAAAQAAGAAGIGPRVLLAEAEAGVLVCEHLGEGWRVAGLEQAADPDFVDRVLATRARLATAGPLPARPETFAELLRLEALLRAAGAPTPPDLPWLSDLLMTAAEQARTPALPAVPIHGDGTLSNVMVHSDGRIRLVDFDSAGTADPCAEIGTALVEICTFEAEMQVVYARNAALWGLSADAELFDRVRLHGIADDLRWAMIAMMLAHVSPRRGEQEFYKFGLWRCLRARIALRDPRFGERTRRRA